MGAAAGGGGAEPGGAARRCGRGDRVYREPGGKAFPGGGGGRRAGSGVRTARDELAPAAGAVCGASGVVPDGPARGATPGRQSLPRASRGARRGRRAGRRVGRAPAAVDGAVLLLAG